MVATQARREHRAPAQTGSGSLAAAVFRQSLARSVWQLAGAVSQAECRRRFAGMPTLGADGERADDGSSATLRRQVVTRSW
jgi:hypothetical protein